MWYNESMSKSLKLTLSIALFSLSVSLFAPVAHAQNIPGISDPVTVTLIPTNPRPGEITTVQIKSFSIDLDKTLVVWSVDGKEQSRGIGLKAFSLQAGPAGSSKTVTITMTTPGVGTFSQGVTIRPAGVSLVWQTDNYTPPFYKGKALHVFGGSFTVIAIPEFITRTGKKLGAHDLVYSWSKNGDVDAAASGYGKSSFTTSQTSYLRQGETVSVTVSAPQDNLVAEGDITVVPSVPKTLLYEDSPLYGIIYEQALGSNTVLTNEEVSYVAEPYFFSVAQKDDPALTYAWTLNQGNLADFANKPGVTLRKTAGTSGVASLGLTIQNQAKLLQGANIGLTINYQ